MCMETGVWHGDKFTGGPPNSKLAKHILTYWSTFFLVSKQILRHFIGDSFFDFKETLWPSKG